jgi:CubicO group peptidase (beta-lactamase class C family)
MIRSAAIAFLLLLPPLATSEDFGGYTLEQSQNYHRQWNLDNWDEGGPLMRYVMLNMSEFWEHSIIDRSGPIRDLPVRLREDVANFRTSTSERPRTLDEYVNDSTVDGAIVVHNGQIVYEAYPRMLPTDKHNYMSISKGLVSTLVAILEDRGLVVAERPIETYIPELAGTDWAGTAVLDILDMASGIDCLETDSDSYSNPEHCYYQFEAALGWVRPSSSTADDVYSYVASLPRHRPAGEAFEYTSQNTFVLAWLIEKVSGRTFADFLSQEIWQKIGADSDAVIVAPNRGVPIVHGGISSTLRDVARFGLQFTPMVRQDSDEPLISDAYLNKIQGGGRPEIFNAARANPRLVDGEAPRHNTYQWDFVMRDGDFFKGGYGGQGLYVSPSRNLVVAFFGAFEEDGTGHEMISIARQLATSGLFD